MVCVHPVSDRVWGRDSILMTRDQVGTRVIRKTMFSGGSMNTFLAAALARVMRVAVPIPAVASASVFHSAAGGGSVVGVVRPL